MTEISKRLLFINIILSQGILALLIILLLWFVVPEISLQTILEINESKLFVLSWGIGSVLLLTLQFFFHKYISKDRMVDEINTLLINTFSLPELLGIFFFGALAEEILFRGIIQPYWGIWLTSLLFTIIHFRYLRKIVLLIEVYLMGIILGFSYLVTETIWVPVLCHLSVNFITAFLIKRGWLKY